MPSIRVFINKSLDYDIYKDVIKIKRNGKIFREYYIKEDYKINKIFEKNGHVYIDIFLKNISEPKFVPDGYTKPELLYPGEYFICKISDSQKLNYNTLSYIDTSKVTPDDVKYITSGKYNVDDKDIPKSFWMATTYEYRLGQNLLYWKNYAENFDKQNSSKLPTHLELLSVFALRHNYEKKFATDEMLFDDSELFNAVCCTIPYDNHGKIVKSAKLNKYLVCSFYGNPFYDDREINEDIFYDQTKEGNICTFPVINEKNKTQVKIYSKK